MLTHGSLFSGIGGFDLGFERAGFKTIWQVEIDPYCQAVLAKHFPNATRYSDIRSVHGVLAHAESGNARQPSEQEGRQGAGGRSQEISCCLAPVDLITGGFPCQPFSVAGKRRGTDDDRFIWPEMHRVIAEVRPRWVVAENVPGLIKLALDQVLSDLEALGYTVGAVTIPACAVDAPHRRERLWIVGYTERDGQPAAQVSRSTPSGSDYRQTRTEQASQSERSGQQYGDVAHAEQQRWQWWPMGSRQAEPERSYGEIERRCRWIPEPAVCELSDGLPHGLVRYAGRVAKHIPNRRQKLQALGNAIVPAIAEEIGRMIAETEQQVLER